MAGHSHAKNVKRTKDAEDQKRALLFSRMGNVISLAAKEGGGDVEKNPTLKTAIEKAKKMNVPKENIEKAIKKGTGELKGDFQDFSFEVYGPEGSALIIEGITDNINRSSAQIKKIIGDYDGKVANPGSVKWMFDKKGLVQIKKEDFNEKLEMAIIESGADDFEKKDDYLNVYTDYKDLDKVKSYIESKDFNIESSNYCWIPKSKIEVKLLKNKILNLIDKLKENEDVQEVYHNLK